MAKKDMLFGLGEELQPVGVTLGWDKSQHLVFTVLYCSPLFHMDSMWNMFGHIMEQKYFTWIPHRMDIFHPFHMESTWNKANSVPSIPHGFHME